MEPEPRVENRGSLMGGIFVIALFAGLGVWFVCFVWQDRHTKAQAKAPYSYDRIEEPAPLPARNPITSGIATFIVTFMVVYVLIWMHTVERAAERVRQTGPPVLASSASPGTFCRHCGAERPPEGSFCENCGAKLL